VSSEKQGYNRPGSRGGDFRAFFGLFLGFFGAFWCILGAFLGGEKGVKVGWKGLGRRRSGPRCGTVPEGIRREAEGDRG
jgi:hypothetical protein